ncbi:MAG: RHS repeat-associated core domain-containing protein, partial [Bacilli bacterium]
DGSVENIYYNDVKVLSYIYNDYGEVSSYTDYKDNVTYYFNYDYQNRLINVNATNGNNITYSYDENSHLVSKTNINGTNNNTYTDVNPDLDEENNVLTQESISGKYNINYSYSVDAFANLETISYYFTSINSVIDAAYTDETTTNANNETVLTGRISQVEFTINNDILKFVYEYDDYSNITKVTKYINNIIDYYEENTYDIFNQLVRQDVLIDGTEYRRNYFYDTRGNIISYQYINQTDEDYITGATFQYRTSGNKDELVFATINGYNYTITYSSSGQPNLYLGWQIGYDMRNITTLENSQYYIEYYYNANNIRTGKYIYNGVKDNDVAYILDGNKIIRETRTGDENYVINYYYDSSDNVIGFEYNNNKYLYLKNLQNDIIGIVDEAGNLVVEYTYDAYGNIIKLVDTSNCDLSTVNPFRYRSYYYDKETGWYYLNSRYYNPIIGRFITMDSIEYLGAGGTNLFSYCNNNPTSYYDINGNFSASLVLGGSIVAQLSGGFAGLMASISASLASIKAAIATAWLPVLAIALVSVAIVGLVYAIQLISNLMASATRARSYVDARVKKGGIDDKNTYNHTVYVIVLSATKEVWYVGRTQHFPARSSAHYRGNYPRSQYTMFAIATGLTYKEARAMEQTLITAYGLDALGNAINSIARKKWGSFAKEFARASSIFSSAYDD